MGGWVRSRKVQGALGLAGAIALGSGALACSVGPLRLARAGRIWIKLQHGKSRDVPSDLRLLGRAGAGLGFAQRLLEGRVHSEERRAEDASAALEALARNFPESEDGQAVREYEELTGQPYFRNEACWEKLRTGTAERGARAELTIDEAIVRWRSFCDAHPDFPGRDDAGLRLARCEEEAGRAREATLTILAALSWGDGDAAGLLRDRLGNVVDAQLSLDDALDLAKAPPRESARGLLVYSAAVKLARAHRFDEAVRLAAQFDPSTIDREMLAHAPPYFVWRNDENAPVARTEAFVEDVRAQVALWDELARASAFDKATRLLSAPHAFANLILHDHVKTDRHGHSLEYEDGFPEDATFLAYANARNHLAQAAAFYEFAAAHSEEPSRALTGAACARAALLGFWGTREGHAVGERALERLDRAARATARALAACAPGERAAAMAAIDAALLYGGTAPGDDPGVTRTAREIWASLPDVGGPDGSCGPAPRTIADALWARVTEISGASPRLALRKETSRGR